ncbi:ATP-binding protein [Ferrimonas senticii]|uniref:ATP-binding protein n=1 Tax=Ferrimonas senticii TaxID=394566 RepID=UPI0004117DC4|nr:ATP-binding protein [Ferrimonas senticii]
MRTRRLTIKLFAAITVVFSVLVALLLYWNIQDQLVHQQILAKQLLADRAAGLIVQADEPALNDDAIKQLLSQHPNVTYGVFTLGGFKNAYRYQADASASGCTPPYPQMPYDPLNGCLISDGSVTVGKAQLYYSLSYDVSATQQAVLMRLAVIVGLLFCGFIGIYFYAGSLFIRPLSLILSRLDEIGTGEAKFAQPLTLNSELRELAEALQQTDQKLKQNHEQDEQLNARLRKALLARSEFMANASHEIRTPINAIIGFVDVMTGEDEDYPDEVKVNLNQIAEASYALLKIVDEVLDFSKLDSSNMKLEQRDFALQESFSKRVAGFSGQAQANGVQLSTEIDERLPQYVKGDEGRIGQIINNLLSNAIKFSANGKVTARLILTDQHRDGSTVRLEVEDTGIGIATNALGSIFDAYSQADTSVTRQYGGTGLGLAICKKLADLMEAKLSVTSRLGQGSCFSLELPLGVGAPPKPKAPPARVQQAPKLRKIHITAAAQNTPVQPASTMPTPEQQLAAIIAGESAPPTAAQQPATPPATAPAANLPLSNMAVMLVEDNKSNIAVMKVFLNKLGAGDATICENGKEAVDACEEKIYELILMDCQMPVMDGFTATKMIREGPSKSAAIIAVTANVTAQDEQMCRDAGMDEFLTKPLTLGALKQGIAAVATEPA